MIAIPALDLREGACVQLVGGSYADERVRMEDPRAVARRWEELGFRRLHLVDLDAATGQGSNRDLMLAILGETALEVQAGGGIRTTEDVATLLEAGAHRVVVGTRAVEDLAWLATCSRTYPGRLMLAADVRGRLVVTRGWSRTLTLDVVNLAAKVDELPLAGLLVTAVHREGKLGGGDAPLMRSVTRVTRLPVHASGGIATLDDLRIMAETGCAGAVLGMALYTGILDPIAVVREFAE